MRADVAPRAWNLGETAVDFAHAVNIPASITIK